MAKDWMTKQEAAELLGVVPRQVERRAAAGMLAKHVEPLAPGQKAPTVLYFRADVVALKDGRPNQHAVAVREPVPTPTASASVTTAPRENGNGHAKLAASSAGAMVQLASALVDQMRVLRREEQAAKLPPWVTIAQAAACSGLSAAWLRAACERGDVIAINQGTERRKRWAVHRESLGTRVAEMVYTRRSMQ